MSAPAGLLREREAEIAVRSVELVYERFPELARAYGPAGRSKCLEDARFHVRILAAALAVEDEALFADYARWAAGLLGRYGIPPAHLAAFLGALEAALEELEPELGGPVAAYVEAGVREL